MKETSLSPSTRALLDAAKSDGPGAAARLKMWGAVSGATGIAAMAQAGTATGTATATAAAAASSAKLLVAGALFGSVLTVGVALTVVRVVSGGTAFGASHVTAPAAAEANHASSARHDVDLEDDAVRVAHESFGSGNEPQPIPLAFESPAAREGLPSGEEAKAARAGRDSASAALPQASRALPSGPSSVHVGTEDALWREESLILEARGALRRKDPQGALASLDAARRVGQHQLEPEEMSVRAKTLRVLGRAAEADEVEASLKARYPDQALIR